MAGDYRGKWLSIVGNASVGTHKLRAKLLDELHQGYPGISKMKAVSRSYFFVAWP